MLANEISAVYVTNALDTHVVSRLFWVTTLKIVLEIQKQWECIVPRQLSKRTKFLFQLDSKCFFSVIAAYFASSKLSHSTISPLFFWNYEWQKWWITQHQTAVVLFSAVNTNNTMIHCCMFLCKSTFNHNFLPRSSAHTETNESKQQYRDTHALLTKQRI